MKMSEEFHFRFIIVVFFLCFLLFFFSRCQCLSSMQTLETYKSVFTNSARMVSLSRLKSKVFPTIYPELRHKLEICAFTKSLFCNVNATASTSLICLNCCDLLKKIGELFLVYIKWGIPFVILRYHKLFRDFLSQ